MGKTSTMTMTHHSHGTLVTPALKDKFLECLREMPNIARACRICFVSRTEMYRTKREEPDFAELWEDAIAEGVERLAEKAWHRAEESSDTLMVFLLRSHDPATYGDKRDITTNGQPISAPVQFIEVMVPVGYDDSSDTSDFQEPIATEE